MADVAGTENQKGSRKTHTRQPHPSPMRQRQAEKSPRGRRRQRIPVLCHLNPKNAWEDSKKTDVQSINGHYRKLRNPHERPRKTLVD